MPLVKTLVLLALFACSGVGAQPVMAESPDWKEGTVPPPPAFDAKRLIQLENPPGSSLTFGVDPATLSVAADGVVRYVVVASSPGGARNVMYEGIRCTSAQYRVYARYHAEGGWSPVREEDWQSLFGSAAARHALMLAKAGACMGRSANRSADDIVRALKADRSITY